MTKDFPRRVMAIGAHADDIEISVGGTLLKYHDAGYEVIYVMSTNNMSGDVKAWKDNVVVNLPKESPVPMMARRKAECDKAAAVLGATPIHLDHPQRHYNSGRGKEVIELSYGSPLPDGVPAHTASILTACENPESIDKLADLILEHRPECILTHGINQRNIEHFATCLLVTNAFWKAVEKGYEGGLLQWKEDHTLHGDFHSRWDTFIDCTRQMDRKMELIGLHACQMPKAHLPDFGHRLLLTWRGKAAGCGAAEMFTWVRRPTFTDSAISGHKNPIFGELVLELIQNSR